MIEHSLAQSMIIRGGWREVDGEDLGRSAAPLDFSMSRCGLARRELEQAARCLSSPQLCLPSSAHWQMDYYFQPRWLIFDE